MSSSSQLNNSRFEVDAIGASGVAPHDSIYPSMVPGRDALQALLAFASLHQQILTRKNGAPNNGHRADPDEAHQEVEQFVLDEVLRMVAERALAITAADGIAIALAANNAIICRASAGSIAPDPGASVDPNSGFSGACLVSGSIVRCDDVESDPRVDAVACGRLGVRSILALPLAAKQTIIGLVEAFSTEAYGFNDSDVRTLNLLAELILAAIRPEEEDRLAEISRRVIARATAPALPVPEQDPKSASGSEDQRAEVTHRNFEKKEPATLAPHEFIERIRPGLSVVLGVVLIALAVGSSLWWIMRYYTGEGPTPSTVTAKPGLTTPATTPLSSGTAPVANAASMPVPVSSDATSEEPESLTPDASVKPGSRPQVTGIRHWTSPDSSTVVIDLQDQVQYEAHRLTGPERIYFDLHDTTLDPSLQGKAIEIQDELVQKIRIAQPVAGVTRVVLETKGASNFSVSLEQNPYRLVVELRKIGAKPHDRAKIDLFAPSPQTASSQMSPSVPALSTPNPVQSEPKKLKAGPYSGWIIALDAGHGGWDLGTVGRKGLLEKDLVLDIVQRLGKLVSDRLGAQVVYTRDNDKYLPLEKRAEVANLAHASLFLSVHANYSDYPSARGVETYYTNTYSSIKARTPELGDGGNLQNVNWTNVDIREKVRESHRFASSVQRSLYGTLASKNPGLPNRGVKEAQYVVLTGTSMPAILAEVSFVSSPTDENNLESESYRQQIADAIYHGLVHYVEDASHTKVAMAKK